MGLYLSWPARSYGEHSLLWRIHVRITQNSIIRVQRSTLVEGWIEMTKGHQTQGQRVSHLTAVICRPSTVGMLAPIPRCLSPLLNCQAWPPRNRTCEHLNDYLGAIVTDDDESSLYLDSDARHFNLGPYHWFCEIHRHYIDGCSKTGLYSEPVCGKCGERITEKWPSHLDTNPAPVCLLFPRHINSLKSLCAQRCFSNIRDAGAGPNEKRSFNLGKVPKYGWSNRPSGAFQVLLELQQAWVHCIESVVINNTSTLIWWEPQRSLSLGSIVGLWNSIFLQMLPSVFLQFLCSKQLIVWCLGGICAVVAS